MTDGLTLEEVLGGGAMSPLPNPYPLYARLRREAPVSIVQSWNARSAFVTRYDDVQRVLKDHETFSNRSNDERGIGLVMGRTLIGMDGQEHLAHRALVTPALAPRALRGEFPRVVEKIAHRIIDSFAGAGRAELVRDFTFAYPLRVFTEILGLPPDQVETFHDWAIDLSHVAQDPGRGMTAASKMKDYLEPLVREKRLRPSNDLISELSTAEVDGGCLSDDEIVSFLRLLVVAGAETTFHLMGSALFALLQSAELLDSVRADRERIAPLLQETLRWESPVQMITRQANMDTRLGGQQIRDGQQVILCIGSANRDERRFPRPDRFDIERQGEPHIAFGIGRHFCAGSRFALLEATVGLNALLDRLPELCPAPGAPKPTILGVAFRSPDHLHVAFEGYKGQ